MQALQDPQARFTDFRNTRSVAVGAGQFVNMIEAVQRMGVDEQTTFWLAIPTAKWWCFTPKSWYWLYQKHPWRVEYCWIYLASISQKLGQSTNTADQTYQLLDTLTTVLIDEWRHFWTYTSTCW